MKIKIKAIVLLMAVSMLTGCGRNKVYISHNDDYIVIDHVTGTVFDIPRSFLDIATAISTVSQEKEYGADTYVYKDGEANYLLFNMNAVVIVATKGSTFSFSGASAEESLKNNAINGVWFTPEEDGEFKLSQSKKKGIVKSIGTAVGDVAITPTQYGMFVGKIATIEANGEEWALFVGAKGEKYKNLGRSEKKIIEQVSGSFQYAGIAGNVEETPESEVETPDAVSVKTPELEVEIPDVVPSETSELEIETSDVVPAETSEPETTAPEEEPEPPATEKLPDTTKKTEMEEKKEYIHLEGTKDKLTGGDSDIYHPLEIGDSGILTGLRKNGSIESEVAIKIVKLYTEKDAVSLLKKICKTEGNYEKYQNAPAGSKWHVVEYTVSEDPDDVYVDIRLKGLDGESLKYRGVEHTERTFDVFTHRMKTAEGISKIYTYYAVPNGCTEYLLECGTRMETEGKIAVYYIGKY